MNKQKIKTDLVSIGRKIAEKMLVVGPGGNISLRSGNIVYMKASGVAFEEAGKKDYVSMDINSGKIVEGKQKPTSEYRMHLACYKKRLDINAVIHTHPTYSIAYAMLGRTLKPFTPDFVAFIGSSIPVIKYVVPAGRDVAEAVSRVIKKHNGVFMTNHGLLTVGVNLKEAYYRTLLIEESVKTVIGAKILGKMKFLDNYQINQIDNLSVEAYRRKKLKSE